MEPPTDTRSRTSSSYAAASARPRTKRFITGLEEFSQTFPPPEPSRTAANSPSPAASVATNTSFFSRAPSPIPKQHPSRASSLRPPTHRQTTARGEPTHTGNGDLAALSSLFGKSWTSLQELASNVLGSDATDDVIKDNPNRPRRADPTSRPPSSRGQWGPSREQSQPGIGSTQERSAIVRAKKREELMTAGTNGHSRNAALNFKRRTSDDFSSLSAPPAESDDRDTLIYVHHVSPIDTMAGISIRYNCQLMTVKKVNRLWSNDGIQARKTLMIPVDACSVRGRRVAAPNELGHVGVASTDPLSNPPDLHRRPSSTITITPANASTHPNGFSESPKSEPSQPEESSNPWTHDHWVLLEGQSTATEIGRLPRSNLGFFPRTRRKSGSISSLERSSTSLDFQQRPSITVSDTSSSTRSMHRSRRSSTSNQFASQMLGPGGVGPLKGRGPSTPGPKEDQISKVLKSVPSSIRVLAANTHAPSSGLNSSYGSEDEFYPTNASAVSTPGFGDFSNAVEGWAKRVGNGLKKALEPPISNSGMAPPARPRQKHMAPRDQRGGFSSTTGGDLIELAQAFEVGEDDEDEDDARTPRVEERGRRSSPDRIKGPRLGVPYVQDFERSRSRGDPFKGKGD